jgi:hypothetical protein
MKQAIKTAALFAALFVAPAVSRGENGKLTYNKDIAPIMQASCQECHHPGTVAPMSLMTFEEARPWIKSIQKAVSEEVMPPFHAVADRGVFKNDIRLDDASREKLLTWISQGAAEGDPKDHPPALKFESEWQIGEPDMIFRLPAPYTVSKDTEDEYKYFDIVTDLPEDVWLQAIECKADNKDVVHHIIATPVGGWAPGTPPSIFEPPYGRLLKKGQVINVQMHYHNTTGKDQVDQSMIGVKFAKYPVEKQVRVEGIADWRFSIPPNTENHPVSASFEMEHDAHIKGLMPHMHLRGKDMKIMAKYPDGREETLLWVPKYDFNWQMVYEFAKPVAAPKGTKILVDAHFDNSKNNPDNPNPEATVKPGQPTTAEMMIGWMHYTLDEENIAAGKLIDYDRRRGGNRRGGGGRGIDIVAIVKASDKNGDGKLTEDEAPEQMKQFFSLIDTDGDGAITAEEAQAAQRARARAQEGEAPAGEAVAAEAIPDAGF